MKRLCLLTTSILLTFFLFVTGCSNDDGNSPQTVTPTSTSGSIAAATTNASGQKTASLSTSTGTYTFTETSAQAASLLRAATVDETKSGTWTFTEKDKTSAKYSGTYKGDISQLAKAEVKLSLTVTQTANSEGQLVNAESVSFDLTATTSEFTATIPEVKKATEAKTEDKTDETTEEPATEPTTAPETEQTANFDASNAASYELGTIVKYTDDDTENEYEVVKNTFFTEESTARAARASVKEEWESTDRYQNDEVMFAKVEQFTQFREYLVLYLLTTYSVNDKNDSGKLEDTYIFLDKDGKKILQWKWQWASNYVISKAKLKELRDSNPGKSDAEIKLEIWNNLSVSDLRLKDPERLILRDYPADGNKTFYYDCAYNRYGDLKAGEGSETIDYNDNSLIDKIYRNYYTQLPNGKALSYYDTFDKPNKATEGLGYDIKCDSGTFFQMAHKLKDNGSHKAWQFEARGDGAFYGRNAQSVGDYVLSIESLGANKPKVSVNKPSKGTFNKETGLIPSDESVKITVPGGFHFHLSWLESEDDEKSSEDTSSTNSSSNSSQSSSGDDNNAGDSSNTSASNDSSSEGGYVEQGTKEIHVPKYITVKLSSVLDTNNDNKHYEGELEPYAQINFINPVYDETTEDIVWTTPDIESVISTWLPAYRNFRSNGTN